MSASKNISHIKITPIAGLSAYKLSKMVNEIDFRRPNLRGQLRSGATTKAVLRALCDRYPNVWAAVDTDADAVGISERQFQRELRRLESDHKLISAVSNRDGGRHQQTTQYFILDRKILNIVETQRWFDKQERATSETPQQNETGDISAAQTPERVTSETGTGDISDSNAGGTGDTVSPKEIISSEETSKPTNQTNQSKLVGRLAKVFAKITGNRLNRKAGKTELLSLAEQKGEECIEKAWEPWIKTRNLDGMKCPLVHFVNEFDETESLVQFEADKKDAALKEKQEADVLKQHMERAAQKRQAEIAQEIAQKRSEENELAAVGEPF